MKIIFNTLKSKKINEIMCILWYVFSILFGISTIPYFGLAVGICSSLGIPLMIYIVQKREYRYNELPLLGYFLNIPLAFIITQQVFPYIKIANILVNNIWEYFARFSTCGFMLFFLYECTALLRKNFRNNFKYRNRLKILIIVSLSFGLTFFLFLPGFAILSSPDDFCFSVYHLILAELIPLIIWEVGVIVLGSFFHNKGAIIYDVIITSFSFMIYIQYMFMNQMIVPLDGTIYRWQTHVTFSTINGLLWVGMIFFNIHVALKYGYKYWQVSARILTAVVIIQLAGIIGAWVKAPEKAFINQTFAYSGNAQYQVACKNNIVVFVLDAVDNVYMQNLLSSDSDIFDRYDDFTLYTNTCSLYTLTNESMPQMFTGADFKGGADYPAFYERLHNNGYEVHFYGYGENTGKTNLKMYIDNLYNLSGDESTDIRVNYKSIISNAVHLALYDSLPDFFKPFARPQQIEFLSQVYISDIDITPIYYDNEAFYKHLSLVVDYNLENCFIMEHIDGAHDPVENNDYEVVTEYCLNIVGDYIDQMKKLGVYDNATIIVTSDHGKHNTSVDGEIKVPTPIFLIKTPRTSLGGMQITTAPEYHTDFLKTILICAGLYDERVDGDRFGPSVFDYKEDARRERTWYNRGGDHVYIGYTYTGDVQDLYKAVEQEKYIEY